MYPLNWTPVKGVFLCVTVMSLSCIVSNFTDRGDILIRRKDCLNKDFIRLSENGFEQKRTAGLKP